MYRDYQQLQEQDRRDAERMAWANRSYLHHCTGTITCVDATTCDLCSNAARLAVQHYRPIIEKRTVQTFIDYFNAGCTFPHGGD